MTAIGFVVDSAWFNMAIACSMEIDMVKKHMKNLDARMQKGHLDYSELSPRIYETFKFYLEHKSLLDVGHH